MLNYYNDVDGVFAQNITDRERISRYSDVAAVYEQEVHNKDYTGPYVTAGAIGEMFPDGRATKQILDIAAGTGLAAVELTKLGFRVMDALDASEGMLELAAKKGLYRALYNIGISAEPLPFPSDKYDAITVSGWHGSISSLTDALPEMIRVVKPGGYICIVMRMDFAKDDRDDCKNREDCKERDDNNDKDGNKDTYLSQCIKLEADGKWEQKQFTRFPGLITDVEGVKMLYKVC